MSVPTQGILGSMDTQRETVEELFGAALALKLEDRSAYLDELGNRDPALRQLVEELLSADAKAGSYLEHPPLGFLDKAIAPGTRIAHYEIVKQIGSGGMGEVFRARDLTLKREVAIKVLPAYVAQDAQRLRRFEHEAQAAAALNHPNILAVHQFGMHEGAPYLVAELLEGETLRQVMLRGPLPLRKAMDYAGQIAHGLAAAHEKGIVHRDLKPENIFVTEDGGVKILDFGLVKLKPPDGAEAKQPDATQSGVVMGTAGYMAPEQVRGEDVDHRADIFAFGVILYEMLSGKRAFHRPTSAETMAAILKEDPPEISASTPSIPPALERLARRCMEKNPEERFQSALDIAFELEDMSANGDKIPPQAKEGGRSSARGKTRERIPIFIAGLATILLTLLVAWEVNTRGPHFLSRQAGTSSAQSKMQIVQFTAFRGRETSPAFSPDGSRVAFAWNGDLVAGTKGFDLYVKAIGSETLLRLTQHPSEWISPTWSPDGTQIAFHRLDGTNTGIYIVPALGGPERRLRSTRIRYELVSPISWSPDGKWIAFDDLLPGTDRHERIHFLSTETWESKRITTDPSCDSEYDPVFSHSGKHLAYVCSQSGGEASLYSLPLASGRPKMISQFWESISGLTWSADDERLIYASGIGFPKTIGEVTIANGSIKQFPFAGSAELPTVSPTGDKLAYVFTSSSWEIWRRDLQHPESPSVEVVPSSGGQESAQYSPDGKHIVFHSGRSGADGVWVSGDDGSDLVQISNPNDVESGSPQWSPDGRMIAFDALPSDRWQIDLVDVSEGIPRKLVTNISNIYRPHWSHDGKWIYFRSDESGRQGLYRCPASGGDAIPLSKGDPDGFSPQESFDRESVYFVDRRWKANLKKVSLLALPGTSSLVEGFPTLLSSESWKLTQSGIYFVPASAPRSVHYFNLATKQVRPVFESESNFGSGMSISPDGRWMLYAGISDINSDIMIAKNFH
jgi:serine/threonine protein kinase/Tol biopolymer transport system component